jgi:hypothetical protein
MDFVWWTSNIYTERLQKEPSPFDRTKDRTALVTEKEMEIPRLQDAERLRTFMLKHGQTEQEMNGRRCTTGTGSGDWNASSFGINAWLINIFMNTSFCCLTCCFRLCLSSEFIKTNTFRKLVLFSVFRSKRVRKHSVEPPSKTQTMGKAQNNTFIQYVIRS